MDRTEGSPTVKESEASAVGAAAVKTSKSEAPWVLVAGGFHWRGGMDRANAELAMHLSKHGTPLYLVAFEVDDKIARRPNVHCQLVGRPFNSFLLGDFGLHRQGLRMARQVVARYPDARVLVNGGNCPWGDLNWVHAVLAPWKCQDRGAPVWFRIKNRIAKAIARQREKGIGRAQIVIANSDLTRKHLIEHLRLDPKRVHTIYLGCDRPASPVTSEQRCNIKLGLGLSQDCPLVMFVGALSYDYNKGLDTLLSAWRELRGNHGWDAHLLVAGGGNAVDRWTRRCSNWGLSDQVRILGFTNRVTEYLTAADLLISPVRYEPYGLNVQEALSLGVPAMVSRSAGVAERYPAELSDMIIENPEDINAMVRQLLSWRSRIQQWKTRIAPLTSELLRYSWSDMAERIIEQSHAESSSS
jgi:glycosyltransferase involved in cell wall biosynthesis